MKHGAEIADQHRIGGHQQQTFPLRLGQQQAIKGIAVQRRQLGYRQYMGGLNRNLHKAAIQRVRRNIDGCTRKPSCPRAALITSSQKEATLKQRLWRGPPAAPSARDRAGPVHPWST